MPQYGEVRVDFITYTTGVAPNEGNVTVPISGLINAPTFSGDVVIEGGLTVSGLSTFNDITVTGDATIGGDLTVSGDINASGVTISGITGLFASGTEAAPSISFVDDTDTGIYSPGANQVAFTTSGEQRLTVTSDGKVGVGTDSPSQLLSLSSSTPRIQITDSDTGVDHILDGSSGVGSFTIKVDENAEGSSPNFIVNVGGSERARIDSNGRLLVGTSTPPAVATTLVLKGNSGSSNTQGRIHIQREAVPGDGDFLGDVNFMNTSDGVSGSIGVARDGGTWDAVSSTPGRLVFSTTADGGSSPTERMRITSDGKVGVATSAPSATLTVGTQNNADVPLRVFSSASSNSIECVGRNTNNRNIIQFFNSDGTTEQFQIQGTQSSVNIRGLLADQIITLSTNNTSALTINESQNVGIGTTTPNALLDVASAQGDGIRIGANATGTITREAEGLRITAGSTDKVISFITAGSEACRIDTSRRLLVGTSTSVGNDNYLQVYPTINNTFAGFFAGASSGGVSFDGFRSRGSKGSESVVSDDDGLLRLRAYGYSGAASDYVLAGSIDFEVDGTPDSGGDTTDMPGRLVFSTTADGSSSPTERMRISNDGAISCTGTSYVLRGGSGTTSRTLELGSLASAGGNSTSTIKLATYGGNNGVAIIGSGSYNFNSGASLSFQTSPTSGGGTVTRLNIDAGGTITFNAYGAGTLSTNASGVISASDGRYKTKTRQVENALNKILALNPTYFKWNEDCPFATEHEEIGFIAQEVAVVIPEASPGEDQENQYRNYHDRAIIAMLVKAMQEQQIVIDELRTKVAALEAS